MSAAPWLIPAADATSGLFWMATYALILRRSAIDRTYGMPAVALSLNVAWEFFFAYVHPNPILPAWVLRGWLLLDLALLAQTVRWIPAELGRLLPRTAIHAGLAAMIAGAYAIQSAIIREVGDWDGAFTGTGSNVVMSLAFVNLLLWRGSARGQSLYIALCKLVGTQAIFVHGAITHPASRVLATLNWSALAVDLTYALLLRRQLVREGLSPWKRL